jgi:hypothetical protein
MKLHTIDFSAGTQEKFNWSPATPTFMFWVYVLQRDATDSFYAGSARN